MKLIALGPVLLALGLLTTGCTTPNAALPDGFSMVTPQQSEQAVEIAVAKLTEALREPSLTVEQQAKLFYERGVRYDLLGLSVLARIDFSRALSLKPDLPELYNFLGVYQTQEQEFDAAYEAFSSVLELDPEYDYAYLNRGIALYYGGRSELAIQDLATFHQLDPQDPYRILWLYFAQKQLEPEQALEQLQRHSSVLDDKKWSSKLVEMMLGNTEAEPLIEAAKDAALTSRELAQNMCEVYFYLGKKSLMEGDEKLAAHLFKLAIATNIHEYIEHQYSLMELSRMQKTKLASLWLQPEQ